MLKGTVRRPSVRPPTKMRVWIGLVAVECSKATRWGDCEMVND